MAQLTFNIPKISCSHCVETITQALHPLVGVNQVSVDIPSKQLEVNYDKTRITIDRMREALAGINYPVASVQTESGEKRPDRRGAECSCCGA
ncbi:MAG: heavy-metal-associated domain-containing protein [Nitrospirae bacterium]|nr:heavy-metal-associated domain-containing protein [Candidatus Manganitrophaceae bacterium]